MEVQEGRKGGRVGGGIERGEERRRTRRMVMFITADILHFPGLLLGDHV